MQTDPQQSVSRIKDKRMKKRKMILLLVIVEVLVLAWSVWNLFDYGQMYSCAMQAVPEQEAAQELAAEKAEQSENTAGNSVQQIPAYRSSEMTLPAGVYRVRLQYDAAKDNDNTIEVRAEKAPYSVLRTNVTPLYAGLHETDYVFWLFEKTDHITVHVSRGSDNTLQVTGCELERTNQLARSSLLVWTVFFVLLDLAVFRSKNLKNYFSGKEKRLVVLGLAVTVILSSWTLFADVLLPGADETFHLLRIEGIREGLLSGQFPVRLQPNWLEGHGYATAFFYSDLFLYFPAVLRLFGFTVQSAYKIYKFAVNMATVLVAYYSFSKMFRSRLIGLLGSFLYTFSLFRLVYIYAVDGVGQYTGILFLPLVCYGFWLIFTSDRKEKAYKKCWIPLTLGMTGMIESHVLTCLLTVIFSVLICLVCIRKVFRKETFLALCKAAAVSVLLNLWYLLPMLDYFHSMKFAVADGGATLKQIQQYGMYLTQLFDFFPKGGQYGAYPADQGVAGETAYSIGMALTFAALLSIYLLWMHGDKRKKLPEDIRNTGPAALGLGMLSLYMSTIYFPWDRLAETGEIARKLIATIQFPNRFLAVSEVLFTIVACWSVAFLTEMDGIAVPAAEEDGNRSGKSREQKKGRIISGKSMAVMAAVLMTAGTAMTASYYMDTVLTCTSFFRIYDETCMGNGYISGGEYILLGTDVSKLTYHAPAAGGGAGITSWSRKYCSFHIQCSNPGTGKGYLELPLLYYKGYEASDVQSGKELPVVCGDNNVVRVQLPAEYHGTVFLHFQDLWYWRMSEIISLLTAFALFWLARKKQSGILTDTDKNFLEAQSI